MQKKADDMQSRRSMDATVRESRFEHSGWMESLAKSKSINNREMRAHIVDRLASL